MWLIVKLVWVCTSTLIYLTEDITNRDGQCSAGRGQRGPNIGPLSAPSRAHDPLRKSEKAASFHSLFFSFLVHTPSPPPLSLSPHLLALSPLMRWKRSSRSFRASKWGFFGEFWFPFWRGSVRVCVRVFFVVGWFDAAFCWFWVLGYGCICVFLVILEVWNLCGLYESELVVRFDVTRSCGLCNFWWVFWRMGFFLGCLLQLFGY